MQTESEARRALELYGDTVRRICFLNLKSEQDTEDLFQEVFLKLLMRKEGFESAEHEKAWIIRVTVNACKDVLRSFYRRNKVPIQEMAEQAAETGARGRAVLNAVVSLPDKYKTAIYLFYFEGYTAVEIAQITKKNPNTVYTWLDRGRAMLKEKLGGADFDET